MVSARACATQHASPLTTSSAVFDLALMLFPPEFHPRILRFFRFTRSPKSITLDRKTRRKHHGKRRRNEPARPPAVSRRRRVDTDRRLDRSVGAAAGITGAEAKRGRRGRRQAHAARRRVRRGL